MEPKSKWRAYRNTKVTPLIPPPRQQSSLLLPLPKLPSPLTKLPSSSSRGGPPLQQPPSPSPKPQLPVVESSECEEVNRGLMEPKSKLRAYQRAKLTPLIPPPRQQSPSLLPSPKLPSPLRKLSSPALRGGSQPPSPSPKPQQSTLESSECEELNRLVHAAPFWKSKKRLSKQLSMCETARDIAWEKRRRQILRQEKRKTGMESEDLTDEDLHELKGCIELGFGFNEEDAQRLCNTLPALDLYFAVNRQLSPRPSPVSTPHSSRAAGGSLGGQSSSLDSPRGEETWRIFGPGENPQQVKTKLRHWAQAVACSVMQAS
ncbi:hypothetical protein Ancab_000931 [Ancistrocladus abbreviatus]